MADGMRGGHLVVEQPVILSLRNHELRHEGRAESMARHVPGRFQLLDAEADLRRKAIFRADGQRARAQLIALRQQQEGGLVEVREGLHGAVILEEAVRGDFLPAKPPRDGILWHMGARNGQQQMVGTYGLTREPLFLDRRAAEIDVGLSVQQPLVDAVGIVFPKRQMHGRILGLIILQDVRQHVGIEVLRAADAQLAGIYLAQVVELAGSVLLNLADLCDAGDVDAPRLGERQRLLAPVK